MLATKTTPTIKTAKTNPFVTNIVNFEIIFFFPEKKYSNLALKTLFFGFYFASDRIRNEKSTNFSHRLVGLFLYLFICTPICISLNMDFRFGFMIQMQPVHRPTNFRNQSDGTLFSLFLFFVLLLHCFGGRCNYSRIVCMIAEYFCIKSHSFDRIK